jgi:hypothetical protein
MFCVRAMSLCVVYEPCLYVLRMRHVSSPVLDNLWSVSGTSSGYLIASITAGMKGRMSLFWQVLSALSVASVAPFFTSERVSHIAADTTGTTWYNVLCVCVCVCVFREGERLGLK